MAHPGGRSAPYLIEDGGRLRQLVRHHWTTGAHRPRHRLLPALLAVPGSWAALCRSRQVSAHGAAGLLLAVLSVPLSWAALITGAGLPGRDPHGPVHLPAIHATHLPDIRPLPTPRTARLAPSPAVSPDRPMTAPETSAPMSEPPSPLLAPTADGPSSAPPVPPLPPSLSPSCMPPARPTPTHRRKHHYGEDP